MPIDAGQVPTPPRVSVVIPCYNLGAFLREAVDSVRAQTLSGVEIIVVDDGSTAPATIAELAVLAGEGVAVVHTPNQGLAAARNEGMRRARGEFLLPLDADDRIAPTFLEQAVTEMDLDPDVGIVYGQVELFGDAHGIWVQPEYSLATLLFENMIVATALFRRRDWVLLGGYSRRMQYGWEDWDFWLALVARGRKVVRLPEVVFYYRIRPGSMTVRMTRGQKLRMFFHLVCRHKLLYLRNIDRVLVRCLAFGRRQVASPRD